MPNSFTRWYPTAFLLLNSLALLITGLASLTANAEFQSTARTALSGGIFLFSTLSLLGGLWLGKNESKSQNVAQRISKSALFIPLAGLVFTLTWPLAWLPAEKSGSLYYYFVGIQPLLGWAAFASGLALGLALTLRPDFSIENGQAYWRNQKPTLKIALVALLLFALTAVLINWLKIWAANEPYWWGAGVPLMAWQVYVILLASILLWRIRFNLPRFSNILIFFGIWGISAWLWASQPLQPSFFFTPPLFPNHEIYPFADLEFFDRSAQYALIGQGINNGFFFDRALYIAFLVYLHTFFNQNYEALMSVQAGLFAVFPAIIYLIGVNLHSRPAGLIAAALASWRGVNALAGMAMIDTSTAKHMLTDFPTGLGLAIFALFLVQWLRDPHGQWHKAALAAGTLGLTSLLRPHVVVILVVFLPAVFFILLPNWRKGLAIANLGGLAFLAGIAPWLFFGGGNVSVVNLYAVRIRNVIEERYIQPQIPFLPAKPGLMTIVAQDIMPVRVPFQVSQFLNNLQTSAHTLPLTPQLLNLRETVRTSERVWRPDWQGDLSTQGMFMLWLGLGLTALGIGAAANKSRLAGLSLPVVFLLYAAANAFARTSGGRYVVPMDWIVILFFGLGLTVLLEAGHAIFNREKGTGESAPPAPTARKSLHWGLKALCTVACLALIGGLIPLSEKLHPLRFEPLSQDDLVVALSVYDEIDVLATRNFLRDNEGAVLWHGTALYPRFLGQGEGIPSWPPYSAVNYPRTSFVLIGPPKRHVTVVLAGPAPARFPHNSDVLVLACKRDYEWDEIFDALLVILPQEGLIYITQPERPLKCPIEEPICNNNRNCR